MTIIKKLHFRGFKSFAKPLDLEFGKGFNCILGPNGSGKSTHYDTRILMSDGSQKKIGDIVEEYLERSNSCICTDNGVYTYENPDSLYIFALNKETMQIEKRPIQAFIKREGEKDLFKITTQSGKSSITTGCHPVMTFKNGKICSEVVEYLTTNDVIAAPRSINIESKEQITFEDKKIDSDFARVIGYLIGDGHIRKGRVTLINSDENIVQDFKDKYGRLFRFSNFKRYKYEYTDVTVINNQEHVLFFQRLFQSKILTNLYKNIPQELLVSSNEVIRALLGGLFDTDGYVSEAGNEIEYSSKNEKLIDDIQMLLLRFSIHSTKKRKIKYASNTKKKIKRPYYYLNINGIGNLTKFYQNIKFECSYKHERLERMLKHFENNYYEENPNHDLLPQEVNILIKQCKELLNINYKPLRKQHPKFAAYIENRCCPSRQGLNEVLSIFENRLQLMVKTYKELQIHQATLATARKTLKLSTTEAAQYIGVSRGMIVNYWEKGIFQARTENLQKYHNFIKETVQIQVMQALQIIKVLTNLLYSNIYWEKIVSIEKVEGAKYVYDLAVEGQHNFVANGMFLHNSNVIDGLCFVLGKMSAKGMRVEKSANLIYNGGKKGSPMKEAEVSIVFDNEKKEFPVEADEIKVSRIVRQNGQSIYKINDEVHTRQQVVDLLAIAKIDPDGHNIMLQGDIVHFMEMKTEERRQIIEEISGISVYEDKKQKAINELTKVEERLNEATIIMTEREANLRELKKDRDQALKYKDLEKNIKSNKATFIHMQLEDKKKKVEDVERKIADHQAQQDKFTKKIEEVKKSVADKKKELQDIGKEIEQKGEKDAIAVQKEVEAIRTNLVKHTERLHTCKNEITKVEERKKQLKNGLEDLKKTIEQLEQSRTTINKKIEEAKTKESRLLEDIQRFKEKYGVGGTTDGLDKIEEKVKKLEEQIQKQTEEQQDALRKKFQLEAEIQQLDEHIGKLTKLGKGMDIGKHKKELEKVSVELQKALEEDSVLATQLREVKEKLQRSQEQMFAMQARESSLKGSLLDDSAVKKILSLNNPKIYGIVSQLGKVSEKYSRALEVAAGPRIRSIVVEDDKIAAECIAMLKEARAGIATFLPLNKVRARAEGTPLTGKGVQGSALDLVTYDKKFKDVFSFVFGSTYVVDDVDTARRIGIGKGRMVTLDGDLMEVSGAMIGGFRAKTQGMGFQQKEVTEGLGKSQKELEHQEKLKTTLEERRDELEQRIERLRKMKSEMEGEMIKVEASVGSLDVDKLYQEREKAAKDKVFSLVDALTKEITEMQEELEGLKKERERFMDGMKGLSNPQVASSLTNMEERRQKTREEVVQFQTEIKNIDMQVSGIYKPEEEKTLKIVKQHDKEIQEFTKEADNLESQLKQQQKALQEQEEKALKFQKEYKNLFLRRNKLSEEISKSEADVTVEDMKIREIQNKINEVNINRAKVVAEKEALEKEYEEFKGVELRQHISLDKLKDEINKFEKHMSDMGNINLRALEVYEGLLKEYDELLKKIDKLKSEKEDVLQMMYEIEGKKKDLFMETYKAIARKFTEIFASLSAKGEALLFLENEEDPLSAGVEIRVRLAGNKFLDIKSLSGGEKTLAALSFIFSIQEHHPASFYLMDEVDAALDKKNSELLSKLIAKYAVNAQYIIISHNDAIISEAEQIYGVSMQTNGISKVVSLKV